MFFIIFFLPTDKNTFSNLLVSFIIYIHLFKLNGMSWKIDWKKQHFFPLFYITYLFLLLITEKGGVNQLEARIWSCDLRANERPKKIAWGGNRQTDRQTYIQNDIATPWKRILSFLWQRVHLWYPRYRFDGWGYRLRKQVWWPMYKCDGQGTGFMARVQAWWPRYLLVAVQCSRLEYLLVRAIWDKFCKV